MTFYDDELDEFLIEKLKLIEPTPNRDPGIAKQRRDQYLKRVKFLPIMRPISAITGLFNRKDRRSLAHPRPALVPLAAAILVIFGLVFGSWGTVYAAQNSLPNDLLYPVKLTGENLQLAFTTNTTAKISLLTKYTDRRMEEATKLVLLGNPIPKELPEMMDKHLDELFILAVSLDEEFMQNALQGIQTHLRDQDQDMTNAMEGLPECLDPQLTQLRDMLKERQQLAETGLEQPNIFQHQNRHREENQFSPITDTLTTTISSSPQITNTEVITPGLYGPGPCESPGECMPPGNAFGPGPFYGEPAEPDHSEGYGPGPDNGLDSQAPEGNQKPVELPNNNSNGSGKKDKP